MRCEPGHFAPPLDRITLLIPLYDELDQMGALLLGHPINGVHYSDEDIELLLYPSDQLAARLVASERQQANMSQAAELLDQSKQAHPTSSHGLVAVAEVENALRNLHDFARLGDSRIGELRLVRQELQGGSITHLDLGKAVYNVIAKAVDKLKPEGEQKGDPPPQVWQSYLILHEAYFRDVPNRDIMNRLYISEGTFNRRRRAALGAVARALAEMEASL